MTRYRLDLGTYVGRYDRERAIVLVGCGGTGSFVAESLCRLYLGRADVELRLVDPDRVEPHNLHRQNFVQAELGMYKAQALAIRLARGYGRPVGYSLNPFAPFAPQVTPTEGTILVGCVDNHLARQAMAESFHAYGRPAPRWWIDSGNGEHWGQVLVGNASTPASLKGAFHPQEGLCTALPLPTVQNPALLEATQVELAPPEDCAEAVEAGAQSPTINQLMATLLVETVRRLLEESLTWMGLYVDLEHGLLRPVEATPEAVARVTGMRRRSLVNNERHLERREPAW